VAIKLDKFSVCMLFPPPNRGFARLPALNASGVHDLMLHDANQITYAYGYHARDPANDRRRRSEESAGDGEASLCGGCC
jgi:hypothetical protein